MTVDELRTLIEQKRQEYITLDLESYGLKVRSPVTAAASKRLVEINILLERIDTELRGYIEELNTVVGDGYAFEVPPISGNHLSDSVSAYLDIQTEKTKDFSSRSAMQNSLKALNVQNTQNVARNYPPIIDKNVSVAEDGTLILPTKKLKYRYNNTER